MGYTQGQLNAARAFDAKLARDLRNEPTTFKGGRLKRRMSLPAIYNTYRECPVGTPPSEREKYIQDNERLYLDANGQRTPAGMVNRHGRVSVRIVYGKDGSKSEIRNGPPSLPRRFGELRRAIFAVA